MSINAFDNQLKYYKLLSDELKEENNHLRNLLRLGLNCCGHDEFGIYDDKCDFCVEAKKVLKI